MVVVSVKPEGTENLTLVPAGNERDSARITNLNEALYGL